MTNIGIDYSLGQSNVDKNGIHFGVISKSTVGPRWYDDAQAEYGDPHCPECNGEVKPSEDVDAEKDAEKDFYCETCEESFWSDRCYPDEALGYSCMRTRWPIGARVPSGFSTLVITRRLISIVTSG